ncbi:spore germination protein [Brevibacillus sp. MS2.2]|uniref:spore germination protein n=1 Tax=Brevibacillus sp. MS2.2 TaxID=2738981 RepID=UPI0020C2F928|nr:spore germination protein [Brevibacillus sp. MS2.2]
MEGVGFMSMFKKFFKSLTSSEIEMDIEPTTHLEMDNDTHVATLQHTLHELADCADLTHRRFPEIQTDIVYFGHLVSKNELRNDVIQPLLNIQLDELQNLLSWSQFVETQNTKDVILGILNGSVAVFTPNGTYVVAAYGPATRNVEESQTEAVITGPHEAFVESYGTNLALIRRRIRSSHLKVMKFEVGEITKTSVYLLYIKDIVNMAYVEEVVSRIQDIEIDSIQDTNMLVQFIDECPYSIFPQFLTSERPDVIASKLVSGRVIGIVEGSPTAFSAPTAFFEFFSSPDDYYQRWLLGTALRLLRFTAFVITVGFTALYVSVTTFHYEMIPETLLRTLVESRGRVPFPPIFEALLMEVTIELLREAGARLPTKVGQTIGIVGGIVIGQAAVQAGLTSNILIISVASSAIASFVIPSYIMSASIRLIRFGLIIMAGLLGNFGIIFGIGLVVIHMCGITNLGTSYVTPIAPMNLGDWRDVFIRAPFRAIKLRPSQTKTPNDTKQKMRR